MDINKVIDLSSQVIKHYESLHDGDLSTVGLQPKLCPAGIWTVGWGHALRDPDTGRFLMNNAKDKATAYKIAGSLTIEQADKLLSDDVGDILPRVQSHIKAAVNENQLAAMVSFAYNVGVDSLYSSTFLKLVNSSTPGASDQLLKWNKATVKGQLTVLDGLTYRRKTEKLLYDTGEIKFFN